MIFPSVTIQRIQQFIISQEKTTCEIGSIRGLTKTDEAKLFVKEINKWCYLLPSLRTRQKIGVSRQFSAKLLLQSVLRHPICGVDPSIFV